MATGDYADLDRDIERAVIEKVVQIDSTLSRGLSARDLPSPARIFPLVIVGAAFPSNPLVAQAIQDSVSAAGLTVVGIDSPCQRTSMMDIFELRGLVDTARETGRILPDLIQDWIDSPLQSSSVHNWLVMEGPEYEVPPPNFDVEWMVDIRQSIFGKTGGEHT